MLKIPKGLKKKKKDKKHKRKEEDLFNEAELEQYRKEHQHDVASSADQSDEWKKFKALTAGVDTVLQKTQEDLSRIKETSFFQRKAPPSEQKPEPPPEECVVEPVPKTPEQPQLFEEEEEEESDYDDTVFDTSYVDAVESGELKLAYIPDSPDKEDEFDPFDTSIVDTLITKNPKKRYLSLGCAVEVLSGKTDKPDKTVPIGVEKSPRRRRQVDLLLGSFDEGNESNTVPAKTPSESPPKTLLDEDPEEVIEQNIDLFTLPTGFPISAVVKVNETAEEKVKLDLSEFEPLQATQTVQKQSSSESSDDEFAKLALARKSLTPTTAGNPLQFTLAPSVLPPTTTVGHVTPVDILSKTPTEQNIPHLPIESFVPDVGEVDPFDTSIADKLLPGKQELKYLEEQLLSGPSALHILEDDDFDPRAEPPEPLKVQKPVRPQDLTLTRKTISVDISPSQREDLLATHHDTTNKPLTPQVSQEQCANIDPFDTSHVTIVPGKVELKHIEKELFNEELNDEEFDPRKFENSIAEKILRKYNELDSKPEENIDILTGKEEYVDLPHTPVKPEKSSIDLTELSYADPFDTSIADDIRPGIAELKRIETELFPSSP